MVLALIIPPGLVVGSVALHMPTVAWHNLRAPGVASLPGIRARSALLSGVEWRYRHAWVPLESISPSVKYAFLAGEDSRFYDHFGFDLDEIRDALEDRKRGRRLRGASTITQQAARTIYLSPSRNIGRKIREGVLTLWMEVVLPKDRILELHLNWVELGPGIFGVEAASQAYFGRSASRLSRDQAAMLAATLPAPLVANPGNRTRGFERRRARILERMSRWYGV